MTCINIIESNYFPLDSQITYGLLLAMILVNSSNIFLLCCPTTVPYIVANCLGNDPTLSTFATKQLTVANNGAMAMSSPVAFFNNTGNNKESKFELDC